MEFENLIKYKINENDIVTDHDRNHIENYRQLIKFFETELANSVAGGKADFQSLHSSCLKCIRFLDNLIFTYEASIKEVRYLNKTIDDIIKNNKPILDDEKKDSES